MLFSLGEVIVIAFGSVVFWGAMKDLRTNE